MSDSAFKSAKYLGYTTAQLKAFIADGRDTPDNAMADEITRREMVAAGHRAVMTAGERLRAVS